MVARGPALCSAIEPTRACRRACSDSQQLNAISRGGDLSRHPPPTPLPTPRPPGTTHGQPTMLAAYEPVCLACDPVLHASVALSSTRWGNVSVGCFVKTWRRCAAAPTRPTHMLATRMAVRSHPSLSPRSPERVSQVPRSKCISPKWLALGSLCCTHSGSMGRLRLLLSLCLPAAVHNRAPCTETVMRHSARSSHALSHRTRAHSPRSTHFGCRG